jgi:hypothetical protein
MATFDFLMILAAPLTSALINNPALEQYNPLFDSFYPMVANLSGFFTDFLLAKCLGLKNLLFDV